NLKVIRDEDKLNIPVNKLDINPSYFIEEIPFCASLTYINPIDNSFGAVGHNIKFSHKENIINNLGDIYLCRLCEVRKSSSNQVGSMYGEKILGIQGNINKVNEFGAKGKIINNENIKNKEVYKVGRKEDVRNGSAQILIKSDNDERKKSYEIDITKIKNQDKPETQSFEFEVKDEELIKDYGGIVQGMSGCPIIQNGKIIGAVSHVIVSNPKCGIGIYIEWMMEG
ncbi:MAG: SpoIVB peptidase S55 domain-containing protein, partial [Peptostreptococcaceae bacterium]